PRDRPALIKSTASNISNATNETGPPHGGPERMDTRIGRPPVSVVSSDQRDARHPVVGLRWRWVQDGNGNGFQLIRNCTTRAKRKTSPRLQAVERRQHGDAGSNRDRGTQQLRALFV